jgi:hypothetical protein
MARLNILSISILAASLTVAAGAQQPGPRPGQAGGQQPARDRRPDEGCAAAPADITGRVRPADNGPAVKRARVFAFPRWTLAAAGC